MTGAHDATPVSIEVAFEPHLLRGTGPARPPEGSGRAVLLEVAARSGATPAQVGRLELLHRGDDHFGRFQAECAAARHEVAVEMYQIRRDPVGRALCDALVDAARRGVRVRLLLDAFGSRQIAGWVCGMRREGVEVRWYGPPTAAASPFDRTHRKLLLFDGARASVGGVNFAAEFSEAAAGRQAWRDVGLWLSGPVAAVLRGQLEAAWRRWGGPPGAPLSVEPGGAAMVAVVGGRDGRSGHALAYRELVRSARRELLLATPYFLPDRAFRDELVQAAGRGVRVVVVIPRRCDIGLFKHAARRLYGDLLEAGVEVRERLDRMVHAKVAVVDRHLAAVGSVNLNRRSFHGNSETLLLGDDPRLTAEISALILDESSQHSEVLSPHRWRGHPERDRLAELLVRPLAMVF